MSRTARSTALQVVHDQPAEALDKARAATSAAAAEVERLSVEKAAATEAYDRDESLADAAGRATAAHERATRLLAKRQAEEAEALARVEAAERARLNAELDRAIAFLGSVSYAQELEQLVEVDRRVGQIVDALADKIVEAREVHALAASLGERLGRTQDVQRSARSPSLAWVQVLGRVAIAQAREADEREAVDGWVQGERMPAWSDVNRPAYDAAVAAVARMMKGAK